jgi:16S rRNA (guanine966-N2)-methyltransferase
VRIIAGRFRRRRLLANPGLTTRPITDFVKETVFSRLGDQISGTRVADVFAGTGTIGLEALSRGAASVVFFEKDSKAVELLKRNVATLGADSECLCWRTDILRCSFRPKGAAARFLPYDLIFFDPPFAMMEDLLPGSELFRVLKQFGREDVSSPQARLVLRTPRRPEFECPSVWSLERHWPFSHMEVFVYVKSGSDHAEPSASETEPSASESDAVSPPLFSLVEDELKARTLEESSATAEAFHERA